MNSWNSLEILSSRFEPVVSKNRLPSMNLTLGPYFLTWIFSMCVPVAWKEPTLRVLSFNFSLVSSFFWFFSNFSQTTGESQLRVSLPAGPFFPWLWVILLQPTTGIPVQFTFGYGWCCLPRKRKKYSPSGLETMSPSMVSLLSILCLLQATGYKTAKTLDKHTSQSAGQYSFSLSFSFSVSPFMLPLNL
jgi:hypothetical protein